MQRITARSTKAEILQYVAGLEAAVQRGPDYGTIAQRLRQDATLAARELQTLIIDVYHAGKAARVACDRVIAQLRQPVLR